MDKLEAKYKQLLQALSTFEESIVLFEDLSTKKTEVICKYSYEQLYRAFRESMIQRFVLCTELFWKYLKQYVEFVAGPVEYNAPSPVIRAAFSAGILSDDEAENALEMIKDRNRTSHIYKEEVAEELTRKIPNHYRLMHSVTERLEPKD